MGILHCYADGGLLSSNPSRVGGSYGCVHVLDDQVVWQDSGIIDAALLGHNGVVTNNTSELYALCRCIMKVPAGAECAFYSDSENALFRVFDVSALQNVPAWLCAMRSNCKQHLRTLGKFTYCLLAGHPSIEELMLGKSIRREKNGKVTRYGEVPVSKWNKLCDSMCNEARARYESEKELEK